MDYEKKYKEALEQAKAFIEKGGEYIRQVMESIFPELKESEDERIRKELLEEIEFIIPHDDETDSEGLILPSYHARIDRYKSYLERQKEQKPVKCIDFDNEFENQVSHLIASVLNGEHEYSEGFVKYAVQSLLGYAQNELKPVEWSEKSREIQEPSYDELQRHQDELHDFKVFAAKQAREHHISFVHDFEWDNFCAELLSYFKKKGQEPAEWSYPYGENETVDKLIAIAECLEMDGDCLFNGYTGTECGKFLRDLARKQIGCKSAEWSEEDETRLKVIKEELERFIMFNSYGTPLSVDDIDWLKNLPERFNLPPKQEWSEEDETHRFHLVGLLEEVQKWAEQDGMHHLCIARCEESLSWLKSLRPQLHWKPSKEQMKQLENAMMLPEFGPMVTTKKQYPALETLYNDLKKL